jgi:hypothetical protein
MEQVVSSAPDTHARSCGESAIRLTAGEKILLAVGLRDEHARTASQRPADAD